MSQSQANAVSPALPGSEQRTAPRIALLLRVGKLCLPRGEFLCVVCDASASGLKVRLFHSLPKHTACVIEFGTGERHALEQVWERDGHAGYRFTAGAIALSALIDQIGQRPRRHLRLRLDRTAKLLAKGRPEGARLCDISQHGALIDYPERLPIGLEVQVVLAGMPRLEGRIRWRFGRAHGLVFQRSFRLDELAELVAALQLPSHLLALTKR